MSEYIATRAWFRDGDSAYHLRQKCGEWVADPEKWIDLAPPAIGMRVGGRVICGECAADPTWTRKVENL